MELQNKMATPAQLTTNVSTLLPLLLLFTALPSMLSAINRQTGSSLMQLLQIDISLLEGQTATVLIIATIGVDVFGIPH